MLYLQGVKLQETIRYNQKKMWTCDGGYDITNTHNIYEVKTKRHIINIFYFKSSFYGFTQSIMLGIDVYYKNMLYAWHVSG